MTTRRHVLLFDLLELMGCDGLEFQWCVECCAMTIFAFDAVRVLLLLTKVGTSLRIPSGRESSRRTTFIP